MTDIDKAMLDPTAVFRTPEEVLLREDMTREQKVEVLRRWPMTRAILKLPKKKIWQVKSQISWIKFVVRFIRSTPGLIPSIHRLPNRGAMTFAS